MVAMVAAMLAVAALVEIVAALPVAQQGNRSAAAALERPCTNTYGPGLHEIELEHIGRRFLLAVPDGLPSGGGRRVPGVIDWHGFSESPWYQNKLVGLKDIIYKYKWIGALPFGTAAASTLLVCTG